MIQDRISTLVELLRMRAEHDGNRLAYAYLKDGEDVSATLTFAELDTQARRIAGALQVIGSAGDRALLLYAPGLEFVAAFFGCLYANRIAVPAYPPHPSRFAQALPRLRSIVEDARPCVLLTTASMAALAETMRSTEPAFAGMQVLATDTVSPDAAYAWMPPRVASDTLAFLQYTSGSTATPKGVMVSHGNLVHNVAMTTHVFGASPDAPMVSWLPVYHDMGLIGCILHPMYAGSSTYLMSPAAFLQRPLRWLQAVSRFRAHTSGGPNFAYDLCARRTTPEQRASLDLSSWRIAFNGAEPVRARTLEEFTRTFEPYGFRPTAVYPCYGLAEATLYVSGGAAGTGPRIETFDPEALARGVASRVTATSTSGRALVSCGQSWHGHRAIIADPERRTRCADGEIGEIWVKGPSVAQGYWNRTDQTIETFGATLASTGDGPFLRTGDLGFVHGGELFIAGRLKDLIIVDGRNHYPQDIELTVEGSHPAFRAGCSAAFAVDVGGMERLVVVAEADVGARPDTGAAAEAGDLANIISRAARRAVAVDHDIELHEVVLLRSGAIPKTTSGKIRRRACREGWTAGSLERIDASARVGADRTRIARQ
jgi:acyl-CoA synthetase (AMP-forming)/AMP-acid ligase II